MTTATKHQWVRVSRKEPCKVCGRPDWCTRTADGTLALCMRTESDRPSRNVMGGWLHRMAEQSRPVQPAPRRPVREEAAEAPINWPAMWSRWDVACAPGATDRLGARLGVSSEALRRLGAVWAKEHHAWAFPMCNENGEMVGMRLRAESGAKWAVTGSHQGLFWPSCVPGDQVDQLLICEGTTDAAALLDLDYDVIGRPSCSACVEMIVDVIRQNRKDVVIVADDDSPKLRPNGSAWFPGREGAERLAQALIGVARTVKIVYPLEGKDVREWITGHGAGRAEVDMVIRNARYVRHG